VQDPDAVLDPTEVVSMEKAEAEKGAEMAFRAVLEYGPKIELDHHLVYHARKFRPYTSVCYGHVFLTDEVLTQNTDYEMGRLLANQGKVDDAKKEFELVISGMRCWVLDEVFFAYVLCFCAEGKYLEVGPSGRKVCSSVVQSMSCL
jgi:hypothetical protein